MKKITLILIGAILFSIAPLRADEGMWILPLIEKLNNKKLAELGFKISAKDIYDINKSSLKDAIVHLLTILNRWRNHRHTVGRFVGCPTTQ